MKWGAWLKLLPGLLVLLGAFCARPADAGAIHFQTAEIAVAPAARYPVPTPDLAQAEVPTDWVVAPLPHIVRRSGHHGDKSLISTWYRFRYPAGPSADAVFFYAPRWQVTGMMAIYADRHLVYAPRSGPQWMAFNTPIWVKLADAGAPAPTEILVHITSVKADGGGLSTVWIGDERAIGVRHAVRYGLQVSLTALISFGDAIVACAAIGLWVWWRKDPALLLLASAALFNIVWEIQFRTGEAALFLPEPWFGWMTICALEWWICSAYLFALRIIGLRSPWPPVGIFAFAAAFTLLTLPVSPSGVQLVSANLSPLLDEITLLGVAVMTVSLWVAFFRKRSHEGLVVCIYNTVWPLAGYHDLMLQDYKISIETICLAPLMFSLILVAMIHIMLRRYSLALSEADSYAQRLQTRIREREIELEASHARLREIARRETVASERQRLMRDMHDGMGSSLMVALAAVERGGLTDLDVAQMLRDCVDDLKLTIDSLETVETDLPLVLATLRYRLGPRFEQAGIQLNWRVAPTPPLDWLDPERALHLLRIVQEMFTNIVKHAGASQVMVETLATETSVILVVEDNGVGFDSEKPLKPGRRGLGNLRQRAAAISSEVRWTSAPGQTRFELRLPITIAAAGPTLQE